MMKRLLRKMREGSTNIDAVALNLDIRRETLEAVLEMAVREGYVEKANTASGCSACIFSSRCGAKLSKSDKTGMYVLTPRGEKYADGVS